ncbi:hypothetical protein BAUCODRAFT_127390 [Baudoinia panamericana UAMH 10762]|uniref:Uncharacterized protein n=1 Tax=Baudoinia panamericana (strain UAMH 10762) TaxID=717646 RepID=M2MJM3_BAUPA|nr:uncharacterized protein BAUCODRAFT_127390 [Baudoinia panamericana UAMH 10762]EMC91493.1 hypothetical protein BAUCODRAFT_127390 [Baudoinia panamericana UAMH 10762]
MEGKVIGGLQTINGGYEICIMHKRLFLQRALSSIFQQQHLLETASEVKGRNYCAVMRRTRDLA